MGEALDDVLFDVLRECRTLPAFLDQVFGFLRRRTDFYVTAEGPGSAVGLPRGAGECLVRRSYYKFDPGSDAGEGAPEAPPALAGAKRAPSPGFDASESYNGAVHANYSWSQSISEVDIIVRLPENVCAKDLAVRITPGAISVRLGGVAEPRLEGQLCRRCKNDPIWSLDGAKLEVHLEKAAEIWWDCLVEGEPKLDVSKLDCSRPFDELPEEARSKIEELAWNQERKRRGLPTSEELLMQERLRRSWNCEGSPFRGPYDPDAVIFN